MSSLVNESTGQHLTSFVSFEEKQEVIRIVQTLLDGSEYIQRIGEPTKTYFIVAYVGLTGKKRLQNAEDTASLLKVSVKQGIYFGRIKDLSFSERLAGDWYKAELLLAKEAEAQ